MFTLLLSTALAQDLWLTNARVIDGTGAPPVPQADLYVKDGRIAAIWPGDGPEPPGDVRVLDAAGATVMPGWFDAHVHLYADAGATMRDEPLVWDPVALDRRLRAYVACGVTTVLDAGAPHELVHAIRQFEEGHDAGPEILFLGVPMSPPDGYLDRLDTGLPSLEDRAQFAAHLDELVALDAAGAKVTVENGFFAPNWPVFTPEQLHTIAEEASARDLGVFVHAMTAREQLHALSGQPTAFVHTAFQTTPRHVRVLAERGVTQISTLAVVDGMRLTHHPERLERALVQTVVPERVQASALDADVRRRSAHAVQHIMAPGLPGPMAGLFRLAVTADLTYRAQVRRMQKTLSRLHEAGVPVVLGSDTANWSVLTGFPHGMTTLREAELLEEAGLDPMAVIVAGTSRAAKLLGVADDRGTVAVGQRADLVILADDPLQGLEAVWSVQWTVKDGVAKTPAEWMAPGSGPAPQAQPEQAEQPETAAP